MYMCVCVYVCMYERIYIYIYIYMSARVCAFVYMCGFLDTK